MGAWLAAYSNYEYEMIAEGAGGLPPEKVETLIVGLPTSFKDHRQQVVYELASCLAQPRVVPNGLYRRASARRRGDRRRHHTHGLVRASPART
jgi:4-carboxymuconolactone decarboxylase